jgi:hypothetical protein
MGARAFEAMHAGGISDEDQIGTADEKAAFDHLDDALNALLEARRISYGTETAVEHAVAAVSNEGIASRRQTQPDAGAESFEGCPVAFNPKATTSTGTGAPTPTDR